MDGNSLTFTAIRGVQAGMAYYVVMVPLKAVHKLFKFEDDTMPAALRAQRVLNKSRVPAIADYILNNSSEYILSSLCASVDGEIEFAPVSTEGALRKVGQLKIDLSATILINDGQHRRAAIEEAIRERPSLGDETISVVLFTDRGLIRSQQMFADLNIHAVRPTKSIKLLYDHRDDYAALTRDVVDAIPLFRDFTCFESSSISNRSIKLFTFSGVHQAIEEFVGKDRGSFSADDRDNVIAFWNVVISEMPDWQRVAARTVASYELRRDMIHAHGVTIQAIALAGVELIKSRPSTWRESLKALRTIDWSRANRTLWDSRALVHGKVNKSRNGVILISNVILRAMDLPLTNEGERIEALHTPNLHQTEATA